ncbi:NCK-interacting protein with SH3 domain-like, partial [Glandiceps talaboti]
MYRAAYSFQNDDEKTLNFQRGDKFTLIDRSDQNWWQVINASGNIGYVPANYVEKDQVSHDDVLSSIDRAMESIHLAATSKSGHYTREQRECLDKLVKHRRSIMSKTGETLLSQPRRKAPSPPSASKASADTSPKQQQQQQQQ